MIEHYTIGALSRSANVNVETIRYYEKIGLLKAPHRASNGYRYYNHAALQCLQFIRRGRELGFGIAEIQTLLELANHPERPCREADQLALVHLRDVEQKIKDLQAMQLVLQQMATCESEIAAHCKLIGTLASSQACP
ncbi:helix-turn-helix domain-containing protein [Methylophilus sp. TWE2]|jgi:DNA-binding transcriptional MerR regulator|uniref:MerR family transcriptional regulator n=1 Tax=Methylophilus sp. TWE2 TaxID=1662285 RepID=UPI00067159B7|nr:helix-turn-helix domain-containing protein [Methylophilus sp. TWE2]AKR43245.1 MerR family transcriptional regulator [Methylophilus sp. TWE2]